MRLLSATLDRVAPSPTMAMTGRAMALRADGVDVIGLSAGEPDFDTPPHIRAAGIAAIEAGQTRYTAVDGIPELKAAIAEKFRRENGLSYATNQIMVASGGKQVLYNALMATLDPGDEVLIPAPYWVSYPDMVRLGGAEPVILPAPLEQGFKITSAQLEAAITPRTKWLILNSPSNPTGAVYTPEEIAGLADVLRQAPSVWILSDDIYEHLTFGVTFSTIAEIAPDLADRTLTMNGVSKAYAMTGWRIGYAGGPAELIGAMRKVQSQSTSNPCSISQHAALAALTGPQDFLTDWCATFRRRRDLVVDRLNAIPGITCPTPDGAFYVYPDISGLIGRRTAAGTVISSDKDFAMALLEEANVAVVFGAAFGLSPAFRVSYACSEQMLETACDRIARFCAGLSDT